MTTERSTYICLKHDYAQEDMVYIEYIVEVVSEVVEHNSPFAPSLFRRIYNSNGMYDAAEDPLFYLDLYSKQHHYEGTPLFTLLGARDGDTIILEYPDTGYWTRLYLLNDKQVGLRAWLVDDLIIRATQEL